MGLGIVKKQTDEITAERLVQLFPSKKNTITDETVALINEACNDPAFNGNEFIEAMLDYQNVMLEGRASIKDYINALKFVAYLESETNVTEAYKRARANDQFVIDRMNVSTESPEYRELTSAASRFRKTPLVKKILTQSDMPLYLMFQGARYKAVAVLANEMENADYSKDRIAAADKLLTHVKPPEDSAKIELDLGVTTNTALDQLNDQLAVLAARQKQHLEAGSVDLNYFGSMTVKDSDTIDVEVE